MVESSDSRFAELPLAAKRRIDAICARFEEAWRTGPPDLVAFCAARRPARRLPCSPNCCASTSSAGDDDVRFLLPPIILPVSPGTRP